MTRGVMTTGRAVGATTIGLRAGGHPTSSRSWSPSHRCGVGSELAIAVLIATTPGAPTLKQSTPTRIHRLMVVPPFRTLVTTSMTNYERRVLRDSHAVLLPTEDQSNN